MQTEARKKLLLILAIAALGFLALDRAVVTPLAGAWTSRSAQIVELEENLSRGEPMADRLDLLEDRWEEIQASSLPVDRGEAENQILKAVYEWAGDARLTLASIKPRSAPRDEEFPTVEFQAAGRGTLDAIARFLWRLETSPLALRVEEVEIAARENALDSLQVDIRFSGLLMKTEAGS